MDISFKCEHSLSARGVFIIIREEFKKLFFQTVSVYVCLSLREFNIVRSPVVQRSFLSEQAVLHTGHVWLQLHRSCLQFIRTLTNLIFVFSGTDFGGLIITCLRLIVDSLLKDVIGS